MAPKAGDIVQAYCSHCKISHDVEIAAVVGDEVATVKCKTCGTSQHFQPKAPARRVKAKSDPPKSGGGRRMVDMSDMPRRNKRPRGNPSRRVVSTTGREIPDKPPPRARFIEGTGPPETPKRRNSGLFRAWDSMTDGLPSRFARPHRERDFYEVGEAILHNVYGMGVVEEKDEDGTLKVLFRDGYQLLKSVPNVPE